MFSIEGNKKTKQGVSKYLLREASKNYIPTQIYNRKDKIGFVTPIEKWFLPHKKHVFVNITQQLSFVNSSYLNTNYELVLKRKPNFLVRLYSFSV